MTPKSTRWGTVALAAAALVLLPALPARAAPARVTDDRFQKVTVAVEGPLDQGGGASFFALVEGFAFTDENGQPATNASTDFFFEPVECLTDSASVRVSIGKKLATATLTGSTTGTCFNFDTGKLSTFSAQFSLTWTATGPLQTEKSITRADGRFCRTTIRTREVAATGTLTWSAPDLGIGGTGAPTHADPLLDRRDHCVTPHPAP